MWAPLEDGKGKKADSPLEPPEGMRPCLHLGFQPGETHFRLLTPRTVSYKTALSKPLRCGDLLQQPQKTNTQDNGQCLGMCPGLYNLGSLSSLIPAILPSLTPSLPRFPPTSPHSIPPGQFGLESSCFRPWHTCPPPQPCPVPFPLLPTCPPAELLFTHQGPAQWSPSPWSPP